MNLGLINDAVQDMLQVGPKQDIGVGGGGHDSNRVRSTCMKGSSNLVCSVSELSGSLHDSFTSSVGNARSRVAAVQDYGRRANGNSDFTSYFL